MTGGFGLKSVASFDWNGWLFWSGIRIHPAQYASLIALRLTRAAEVSANPRKADFTQHAGYLLRRSRTSLLADKGPLLPLK